MKKILLHVFSCFMLIHLVGDGVFKCFNSCMKSQFSGLAQENILEDESEIPVFRMRGADFPLRPLIKRVFLQTDVTQSYSRRPYICAHLSIFSPPPNFC